MAHRKMWFGILAASLVFALGLTSCDNGNTDSAGPLDGTWEAQTEGISTTLRITCSGSNWTMAIVMGDAAVDMGKGRLKVESKKITITPTQILNNAGNWETATGEKATPQTGTLSEDGKSFTVAGDTFTKK